MIEGHEIKKIYDEYKQVVFKVAYKYSRNSEVANDIAHSTRCFCIIYAGCETEKVYRGVYKH